MFFCDITQIWFSMKLYSQFLKQFIDIIRYLGASFMDYASRLFELISHTTVRHLFL